MTSSKAGKAGWLEEMISGSQGRKLVKSEQFCSIPAPVPESHFLGSQSLASPLFSSKSHCVQFSSHTSKIYVLTSVYAGLSAIEVREDHSLSVRSLVSLPDDTESLKCHTVRKIP
jgi:hypothetical protein